jgi:MFS family permease
MVNITFWQVIVSKKLLIPDPLLPVFPMFRSVLAIVFLFTIVPRLARLTLRTPLLLSFGAYLAGQTLLLLTPTAGISRYVMLCVSLTFDGFGSGTLAMLAESLVALHVNKEERARVMSIQHMIIMFATSPFGWIGGILSGISRNLPFILTICMLLSGIGVTVLYYGLYPGELQVGSYAHEDGEEAT